MHFVTILFVIATLVLVGYYFATHTFGEGVKKKDYERVLPANITEQRYSFISATSGRDNGEANQLRDLLQRTSDVFWPIKGQFEPDMSLMTTHPNYSKVTERKRSSNTTVRLKDMDIRKLNKLIN